MEVIAHRDEISLGVVARGRNVCTTVNILSWIYHFGQYRKSVKAPNWEICASAGLYAWESRQKADVSGRGSPLLFIHTHSAALSTTSTMSLGSVRLELLIVQDTLNKVLKTPNNSPHCGQYLLGQIEAGFYILKGEDPLGLKTAHALWKSILRFLFTPRSDDEVRQLLASLSRCTCSKADDDVACHELAAPIEKEMMKRISSEETPSSTALIVYLFSKVMHAVQKSKLKTVAKRTAETWPRSPEDLMPFGASKLVESLMRWAKFTPDAIIYALAGDIHHLCGSLLLSAMLEHNVTGRAIEAGRDLFDRTMLTLKNESAAIQKAFGFPFQTQAISLIYYFRTFLDDLPMNDLPSHLEGYELKSTQVMSLLALLTVDSRLSVPKPSLVVDSLCSRAVFFYHKSTYIARTLPEISVHPDIFDLYRQAVAYGSSS